MNEELLVIVENLRKFVDKVENKTANNDDIVDVKNELVDLENMISDLEN